LNEWIGRPRQVQPQHVEAALQFGAGVGRRSGSRQGFSGPGRARRRGQVVSVRLLWSGVATAGTDRIGGPAS